MYIKTLEQDWKAITHDRPLQGLFLSTASVVVKRSGSSARFSDHLSVGLEADPHGDDHPGYVHGKEVEPTSNTIRQHDEKLRCAAQMGIQTCTWDC